MGGISPLHFYFKDFLALYSCLHDVKIREDNEVYMEIFRGSIRHVKEELHDTHWMEDNEYADVISHGQRTNIF